MPRKKLKDQDDILSHNLIIRVSEKLFKKLEKLYGESDCQSIAEVARKILSNEDRNYYYPVWAHSTGGIGTHFVDGKLKGVKYVTITLAGSLAEGTTNYGLTGLADVNLKAFDPSIDYWKVTVNGAWSYNEFSGLPVGQQLHPYTDERQFTDVGKFHAVTITIPTTKEALLALNTDWDDAKATAFLDNPNFEFYFQTSHRGELGYDAVGTALIVEKIEFGFETKPTWAP